MRKKFSQLSVYVPEEQKRELVALRNSMSFWKKGLLLFFLMPTLIWLFALMTVVHVVVFLFRARLDRIAVRFVKNITKQIKGRFTGGG